MAGAYAYTPSVWLPMVAAVLLAAIGLYSWQRREIPGARWLAIGSFIGCVVPLGVVLEAAALPPAAKVGWQSVQAAFTLPGVAATTCFALEYAAPGRWLTRRILALLWTPALLGLLAIAVTGGQVLGQAQIAAGGTVERTVSTFSRIAVAYGMALFLVNTAAFLWLFVRSPQHRWPVALMVAAQLLARGGFVAAIAHPDAPIPFDPLVASTLLVYGAYAIALFGYRIFDPLPAARQAVLEQMHTGVVVFDAGWRVLSLNPAAEAILGVRAGLARGKTWQQVWFPGEPLPAFPEFGAGGAAGVAAGSGDAGVELPDVTLGAGAAARHYAPALSTLTDFRGLPVGHLLMLRDVTEHLRADAEALERQRLQATLRERERLARELHDSIGQVFGFANLKLGAARKLLADGDLAKADANLAALERIVDAAHADLREYILNLGAGPSEERPFLAALRRYLDGYRQNYGIRVDLSVGAGIDDRAFPLDAQMQLFRILQEALSNARKHAGADCVWVSFEKGDGPSVRMRVRDDGRGFDLPAAGQAGAPQAPDGHFGLRFMGERAEQLGAGLRIESAPGQGTCVDVEVPL
jgi:signal transduction histidine kinase